MLTSTTTPLIILVSTIKLLTPNIANNIHGIVAITQLILLPIPICSWTTSLNASVLDQKVVSSAKSENIPASIIAHEPMLSPNCIYANSLSSVPLVPRSTVSVTISTSIDDNTKPINIDFLILCGLPSSPLTTCITAWLADVANTTILYKASRLLIWNGAVYKTFSGLVNVPAVIITTITIRKLTAYFCAIPTAFIPINTTLPAIR